MNFTCYLEDAAGLEYKVIAEISIEPAQDGGMTEPSWEASWAVDSVQTMNGLDITERLTVEDAEQINQQVIQHFEDLAKD